MSGKKRKSRSSVRAVSERQGDLEAAGSAAAVTAAAAAAPAQAAAAAAETRPQEPPREGQQRLPLASLRSQTEPPSRQEERPSALLASLHLESPSREDGKRPLAGTLLHRAVTEAAPRSPTAGMGWRHRFGGPSLGPVLVQNVAAGAPHVDMIPALQLEPVAEPPSLDGSKVRGPPEFRRIQITGRHYVTRELVQVREMLSRALQLRDEYLYKPPKPSLAECANANADPVYEPPTFDPGKAPTTGHVFRMVDGVVHVWADAKQEDVLFRVRSFPQFTVDLEAMMQIISHGPTKSYAYSRLKIMEARFRLHLLLNEQTELAHQRAVPHRDFYNIRKIDNHVHHSACMNQKHLLRFIKTKLREHGDDVVAVDEHTKRQMTLRDVFESLKLTPYDLSVDSLDMSAADSFQRFDKFNLKYNPVGKSILREIFLKVSNHIRGRYLAEITQEVFQDLEANKYQLAEYRLSIYGKERSEWSRLGEWVVDNKMWSKNVRWMIQIPRLYSVYKQNGLIANFQEMLDNIFLPLFEVTVNPAADPKLHTFLCAVVGFDSVDDESLREAPPQGGLPPPEQWTRAENPPYSMMSYYIYANLYVLNHLRASKGFSTFAYRPHAGEAGELDHVATTFLLAQSINHGLVLWHSPSLQYLYYLAQVGISMSPLSNNLLFVEYEKNPFPRYFARGLNVALSTDDPLMIHVTKEPLMEEFSVASQVWKLSSVDLSEIARNSVMQSGFEAKFKAHWVSQYFYADDVTANDIRATNLPDIRFCFRLEMLREEHELLREQLVIDPPRSLSCESAPDRDKTKPERAPVSKS